jgi:N-acetylglucosamine-6-sulfatase
MAEKGDTFDEADVSDKPGWVRTLSLESTEEKRIDELYSKRLKTMGAVGEMIGGLLRTLEQIGKLDNTFVVLTSDNDYHMGQHRLGLGKQSAYEEDIRVPLMIRGPGLPAGVSRDEMILNNDFAPTFADLANLPRPASVDGRSFASLLDRTQRNDPTPKRSAFEIRNWDDKRNETTYRTVTPVPAYRAVRTQRFLYVEYETGSASCTTSGKTPTSCTTCTIRRTRISSRSSARDSMRCATAPGKVVALRRMGSLNDLLAPEIVLQGLAPGAQYRATQGAEDAV